VIARSSFAEFARTSFPNARINEFADWAAMVEAVRTGQIDLAYRDDFEVKKLLVDDPSLTVVARSITLTDRTDTLAVAVRPEATHMAAFIDLFLELRPGAGMLSTDDIVARYRAERGV
jgi:ABC-type amino acid transport substrate-binding protein